MCQSAEIEATPGTSKSNAGTVSPFIRMNGASSPLMQGVDVQPNAALPGERAERRDVVRQAMA
ncbi:MAG: hypothetical protein WDN24_06455 [Sphingomonas sp.]